MHDTPNLVCAPWPFIRCRLLMHQSASTQHKACAPNTCVCRYIQYSLCLNMCLHVCIISYMSIRIYGSLSILCVKSPLSYCALLRFEYTLNGFSAFVNDEGTRTFLSLNVLSGKKEVWTHTVTWSIIAGWLIVQFHTLCIGTTHLLNVCMYVELHNYSLQ